MSFTNIEYTDMILCYGECSGNASQALILYRRRYPNRRIPARASTITDAVQRLRDHGSLQRIGVNAGASPLNPWLQEEVLDFFDHDPKASTREAGRRYNISHVSALRLLKKDKRHPYHIHKVQALISTDYEKRMEYCYWILGMEVLNPGFVKKVLWSDESTFTRDGVFNKKNSHYWAHENPRLMRETSHQVRWSINVWAGIYDNKIVGPYFLPSRMNGAAYAEFVRTTLADYIDDLPLRDRNTMWFQQDGASVHYARDVTTRLEVEFGNQWIGRQSTYRWPPRSPDLTLIDFFLWGYVKQIVFETPSETREQMQIKIEEAFRKLNTERSIFLSHVYDGIIKRAEKCIEMQGRQFEHLLS